MIKIKNHILNENKINQMCINEENNLEIDTDNGFPIVIKDANFLDIEWNYEYIKENTDEYIKLSNEYYRLEKSCKELKEDYITLEKDYGTCELENSKLRSEIKELEEEKNRIKSDYTSVKISCNVLENRIDKAIEYIENTYEKEYHKPKEEIKNFNLKNCTYEPSLVVLGILKGEENE